MTAVIAKGTQTGPYTLTSPAPVVVVFTGGMDGPTYSGGLDAPTVSGGVD